MKDIISMPHSNAKSIGVNAIDKVNVAILGLVCQHVVVNRNMLRSNYAKPKIFNEKVITIFDNILLENI